MTDSTLPPPPDVPAPEKPGFTGVGFILLMAGIGLFALGYMFAIAMTGIGVTLIVLGVLSGLAGLVWLAARSLIGATR